MSIRIVGRTIPPRNTDPETSVEAYVELEESMRAHAQRLRLLAVFAKAGSVGLTADEAVERAGLEMPTHGWARCSDLKKTNHIEVCRDEDGHMIKRPGNAGKGQQVSRITAKGYEALREAR